MSATPTKFHRKSSKLISLPGVPTFQSIFFYIFFPRTNLFINLVSFHQLSPRVFHFQQCDAHPTNLAAANQVSSAVCKSFARHILCNDFSAKRDLDLRRKKNEFQFQTSPAVGVESATSAAMYGQIIKTFPL